MKWNNLNYSRFLNERPSIRRIILPILLFVSLFLPLGGDVDIKTIASRVLLFFICFVLVIIWNIVADSYADPSIQMFTSAEDAQPVFIDIVQNRTCGKKAIIIQHSLLYAKDLIREISKKNISEIEVYLQHPDHAINVGECGKIISTIHDFVHNKEKTYKNISLRFYTTPPSFRGALVTGTVLIAGWYIFVPPSPEISKKCSIPFQIYGHNTPAVVIRSDAKRFYELSAFVFQTRDGLFHNSVAYEDSAVQEMVRLILAGEYHFPT
jgi:hypothetical protein